MPKGEGDVSGAGDGGALECEVGLREAATQKGSERMPTTLGKQWKQSLKKGLNTNITLCERKVPFCLLHFFQVKFKWNFRNVE